MLTERQNPIEIMMLDEVENMTHPGTIPHGTKEDKAFLLRLDVVECWHLLRTHESLKPWRWFLRNLPQAFTIDDLRTEIAKRPRSAYNDRAHDLIEHISLV